ncbi:MAG: peptidoglycan DD-metalloendopeptidase family protein [Sphingomonas sp.]|uniref:peptidoglycan DD-metalloendopeptidase family protein n=1 Tax=Sphingomonas sp. TaxID=28214 RepID=UPI003F7DA72E
MRGRVLTIGFMAMTLAGCIPQTDYGPPADAAPAPSYDPAPPPQDLVPAPPSAPPAWEARPVTADARIIPDSTYVVQPGDTLRRVADTTGSGSEIIARANGIDPPFTIRVGQQLRIPGGRYHLVRPGESGIAIARAYGVRWADIVAANDLIEPYVLRSGRRILIPGGARPPQTLAERAAAFKIDLGDIATGGGEPAIPDNVRPVRPAASVRHPLPSSVAVGAPSPLSGPFVWPVASNNIVKRFGAGASGERNDGIKIAVPIGTPIKAVADGVVIYTTDSIAGLGGLVMVRHGDGWTSVYGHASRIMVTRGQAVKRGQTIALSGDTGFADRPELHFELRKGRTPVDPLSQLPKLPSR